MTSGRDASAPRIAVVGSGLAGLTAAWLLGRRARVTVYEEHDQPGMGAHSIRVGDDGPLIDVPLRVFTPAYYPKLLELYGDVGIRVAGVDYAASFSRPGSGTYFRYRNVRIGGRSIPWVPPLDLSRRAVRAILRDLRRIHREGPRALENESLAGRSLGSYLDAEGYSRDFVDGFLLPTYAAVCTCSFRAVDEYPADVVVRYLCSGVTTLGVMRAEGGSASVVRRLLERAEEVRTSCPVRRINPVDAGVEITDAEGEAARFDHVVLAARAEQGADLVVGDPRLTSILARVPHERSRVVVHGDPRLAPEDRASWRPVNMISPPGAEAPMATIWLNRVQDGLEPERPLFQTWNPLREPDPATILTEARVSRPVVTVGTRDVPDRLRALHDEPDRRIWPVGSYAEPGIPLLEAAAASALRVARRLSGGGPGEGS